MAVRADSPLRLCECGRSKTPYRNLCRACDLERRREQRKTDQRNTRNRERMRQRTIDAAKKRARDKANDAIRRGKMQRQPCEVCGDDEAQMHHDDYGKPLEIRWLCRKHHRELHTYL